METVLEKGSDEEYCIGEFGDARLKETGARFFRRIVEVGSICLRRLGQNRKGEMQFGRWLRNRKVTYQEITRKACEKTSGLVSGLHILAIQDGSEINYQKHAKRIAGGLGTVGNGTDIGLFIHPMLAIEAKTQACLGIAHQETWIRTKAAAKNYQQLPIEEKESYRWLKTAQAAKEHLSNAGMITIIADRESDLYEEWDRIPDDKTHVLTRMCRDRKLANEEMLFQALGKQPVQACYRLHLAATSKRSAHEAHMEIRYCEVEIKRPKHRKTGKASIVLRAIEVCERSETVIGKEAPIQWRLMTTHRIESVEEALQCVDWYCQRWQIEQLFRTIKKQGLNLESSQIEEGESLIKLASVAVLAAVRTLQLTMAREGKSDQLATDVFDTEEITVLEELCPRLEGLTEKQKIHFPPKN